jgi:hypothetical protein
MAADGKYKVSASADGKETTVNLYVIPRNITLGFNEAYWGTFGMNIDLLKEGWKNFSGYIYGEPSRNISDINVGYQKNGTAATIKNNTLWFNKTEKISSTDVNSRTSGTFSFKYNITDSKGAKMSIPVEIKVVTTFEGVYVGSSSAGVNNAKDTDYTWTIPSGTNSTNVYLYYYCQKNGSDAHDYYYEHKDLRYEKPNPLKVCETAASTMGTTAREIKVK